MKRRRCPACLGRNTGILGILGRLTWWLCRDCGMHFYKRRMR
jgi:hypothetical protein